MADYIIVFQARIYLAMDELDPSEGEVAQLVQDEIGHTGAVVEEVVQWDRS